MTDRFNIRVYGLFIRNDCILVTDEFRNGLSFTKFPGGGLKLGEGTRECLERECREELGQEVKVKDHFYTTDYFQPSAFNSNHQLISIYFFFSTWTPPAFEVKDKPFDFKKKTEGAQVFRWVPVKELAPSLFCFPVDQKVVNMLIDTFEG